MLTPLYSLGFKVEYGHLRQNIMSKMDIEKSRNGFYTLTFLNKNNLDESEIHKEFSSVGNVCNVVKNSQRVFIRYQKKDEAERALKKFGKVYDVVMAKNRLSDNHPPEGNSNHHHKPSNNHNQTSSLNKTNGVAQSMEKLLPANKVYHLILGNLPQNYTIKDIKSLVEEANPVCINQIEETKVFNLRFCHIVLNSAENLTYLIDKLNGFMISGEKLIAAEMSKLIEWKQNIFNRKSIEIFRSHHSEEENGEETDTVERCGTVQIGDYYFGATSEPPKKPLSQVWKPELKNSVSLELKDILRQLRNSIGPWEPNQLEECSAEDLL